MPWNSEEDLLKKYINIKIFNTKLENCQKETRGRATWENIIISDIEMLMEEFHV